MIDKLFIELCEVRKLKESCVDSQNYLAFSGFRDLQVGLEKNLCFLIGGDKDDSVFTREGILDKYCLENYEISYHEIDNMISVIRDTKIKKLGI